MAVILVLHLQSWWPYTTAQKTVATLAWVPLLYICVSQLGKRR